MADRTALAKEFMALSTDRKFDDVSKMLADDVVASNPMTGAVSGKAAVEAGMRSQPEMPGMEITWSDPQAEGDNVSSVGTGLPFGPIKMTLTFNADDKINKIDIGMGG
ncbi:MAG: nuclear transport factor 2 family protein [Dehalococcoidia bacterium]